jgi:hypothetical protein
MWISFGLFHTMRSLLSILSGIYLFREFKSWNHGQHIKVHLNRKILLLSYQPFLSSNTDEFQSRRNIYLGGSTSI